MSFLLEHGASCSCRLVDGRQPLHVAATLGLVSILQLLLRYCSPDEVNAVSLGASLTPLHYALLFGQEACVSALLEAGADCTSMVRDNTLHPVLLAGHVDSFAPAVAQRLIVQLVAHGTSLALRNRRNEPVLSSLLLLQYPRVVEFLLDSYPEQALALCKEEPWQGNSPLSRAFQSRTYAVVRKMVESGVSLAIPAAASKAEPAARLSGSSAASFLFRIPGLCSPSAPLLQEDVELVRLQRRRHA